MRRSASEIINELEQRVSKLENSSFGRKASFGGRLLSQRRRTRDETPMPHADVPDLGFNGRPALLAYLEAVSAIEKACKQVKSLRKVDSISKYYVSKKLNALKFFKKMTQDNGDIVHNGVGASKIGYFDFVYKSGVAVVYDQLFSLGFHIKNWMFEPYSGANGSYVWDLEVTLTLGHYDKNPTVIVGHIRSQRDVVRVVSKLLDECDTLIERNYDRLVMSPKTFGKIDNMTYRNEYDS